TTMAKFSEDELYDILLIRDSGRQLDAFINFYNKYENEIFKEGNVAIVNDFVYSRVRNDSIKLFWEAKMDMM
ncbi:MAG: hypothetical protein GX891_04675, partial [Clostridiales bacterium]|nr:hypothetical protein [Clostridiales bacterium]